MSEACKLNCAAAVMVEQILAGDITYIQTIQGWLYLAVMIDLFSRQVCAKTFLEIIGNHERIHSMSRKGNCWESEHCSDAVAESFFATFKKQAIHGYKLKTKDYMRS